PRRPRLPPRSDGRGGRGRTIRRTGLPPPGPRRSGCRGSGRRGVGIGPRGAAAREAGRLGIEAPQVLAGLLELLLVADGPVAIHQPQQRVRRPLRGGIIRNNGLGINDRGVPRFATQIEDAGLVRLLRKLILQATHVRTRPRSRLTVGKAGGQLLINGQRGLAVRGVELRAVPEPEVRVSCAQQGQRRVFGGGGFVGGFAKIARRLHVVTDLER